MSVTLRGDVIGAGPGVPLVLVHGFPLDGRMWEPQVEGLREGRSLVVPDLAGFGRSAPPGAGYSIEDHAGDLEAFLTLRGVGRAVLCGFSMGGYVALAFAGRFPERLAGLVLASTRAGADTAAGKEGRSAAIQRIRREGTAFLVEDMGRRLVAPGTASARPDLVDRLETIMAGQGAEGCEAALAAMRDREDRTSALGALRCPLLVVTGAEDGIIPSSEGRSMAALAAADLAEIAGAGHAVPFERPEAFNAALASFLARIDAGGGETGEGRP